MNIGESRAGEVTLFALERDKTCEKNEEATTTELHTVIHINVIHIAPPDSGPLCEP